MPLYNLSKSQRSGLTEYFKRNSTKGIMGKKELMALLNASERKPSDKELQQMIDAISVDSSGISFQAFVDYVANYQEIHGTEHEYREAFRIYDVKGTGQLTKEDIAYVFEKMRIKVDLDQLFAQVDTDRSGTIDYDEFVEMMKKA